MTERGTEPDEVAYDDPQDDYQDDREYVPGGRRRKGRGLKGCVAVLVALVVLLGGFYVALTQGVSWVADQFQGPDDYPGPGKGSVEFTVNEGDSTAQIGRNLKADGVTKSVQAFIDAAAGEPDAAGIQVGAYELQKQMKAADALEVLLKLLAAPVLWQPTMSIIVSAIS